MKSTVGHSAEPNKKEFIDSRGNVVRFHNGFWITQGYAPQIPWIRITDPSWIKRLDIEANS